MAKPEFTDLEKQILALAGGNLPDSATPFKDIADEVGTDEETVIALVQRLKDAGIIRRFGATLRHQKAGYGSNAMVAWILPEDQDAEKIGEQLAARPEISHCYIRNTYPEWPYAFYTMIHGKKPGDCQKVVDELIEQTGLKEYSILHSLKELKKTSMVYFQPAS